MKDNWSFIVQYNKEGMPYIFSYVLKIQKYLLETINFLCLDQALVSLKLILSLNFKAVLLNMPLFTHCPSILCLYENTVCIGLI